MANNKETIKRSDYNRVLITETIPDEKPIVFSNDGLYRNCNNVSRSGVVLRDLLNKLVLTTSASDNKRRIPYSYRVRKDQVDFRRLSLIHPRSQWDLRLLYEEYAEMILYLCSRSDFSIRYPYKIASRFYVQRSNSAVNRYRTGRVMLLKRDPISRYSPSFFAYKYNKQYKFFDSMDFCNLEKRYKHLWRIDVAKCFESIYTHTLSWAIKDKEFTKKNKSVESTFGQLFDRRMQLANNGETNGIVIGPEASRIFAEIIFQAIDRRALVALQSSQEPLNHEADYAVRRYVDDVFIFANSESVAQTVYDKYAEALEIGNMKINSQKTSRQTRPFLSDKSRAIRLASQGVNEFIDSFCKEVGDPTRLVPTKIRKPLSLMQHFIASCREMCSSGRRGYDEVASFLIGALLGRIKKIVNVGPAPLLTKSKGDYAQALRVILELMYFLYNVSPEVNSSYHLATAIILTNRFAERHLGEHALVIKQAVYDHTEQLLSGANIREIGVKGYICLEVINIVLAASDLGKAYLLPESEVRRIIRRRDADDGAIGKYSYFGIVSCLFYIKRHQIYSALHQEVVSDVKLQLASLKDAVTNTEKALLLLDMLACPHLDHQFREKLLFRFYRDTDQKAPTQADVDAYFAACDEQYWFVKWKRVDLLNELQKTALRGPY
jgi:hypothetical protein